MMKTPRTIPMMQIDAFTSVPFRGNPAAVCLLEEPLPEQLMLAIAAEMNLSETAFVHPADGGSITESTDHFKLRWFTPSIEVQLCGHATLATSAALFERLGRVDTLRYDTRSGELRARRSRNSLIQLDFPADPITRRDAPSDLVYALGLDEHHEFAVARSGHSMICVEPKVVRDLKPNFEALKTACEAHEVYTIIVTSEDESGTYDFVSRFFGPAIGINEDPVTGAAHCVIGPYWAQRLSKATLKAHQASARGGELLVEVEDDRVLLTGRTVTVMRGEIILSA